MKKLLFTVGTMLLVGFVLAGHREAEPLHTKTLELGDQSNNTGNYLDIVSFKKYNSREAGSQSDKIHCKGDFGIHEGE